MSDLLTWVVVGADGVGVDRFQAPQEYVDEYEDRVVNVAGARTPDWWSDSVRFINVTSLDPQPSAGWKLKGTKWTPPPPPPPPPPPTAEELQRQADDEFLADAALTLRSGGSLTQSQRDRLLLLQIERAPVVTSEPVVIPAPGSASS